jgi:hypothetical protein
MAYKSAFLTPPALKPPEFPAVEDVLVFNQMRIM